ncbi:hypothetical protein IJI28_00015 [Candidatus Saccharibacteria bacterium]|nr:hypothetical protein [Candidatus Saccharibacteria bacterium]
MNKAIQSLFLITTFSGIALSSSIVSADDNTSIVDEINITVPVSCTISGTGQNTHNANINNGLYEDDIGTTTLHAFCNDNEGFAIYAAGYTGNEVGGENSNKLVGTNAGNNATIESGTATTAGNPDVSNWAMKLAITQDSGDTTGTNAFTIDSAPNVSLPSQAEQSATSIPFSQYHVVPNEYTKVAHKNSNTDMTESTGGVKLTTTYAAYISKTQPADTYTGQVIYTLVHPASAAAPRVPISCNPSGTTIGTNSSTDIKCMQDISSTNKSSVLASMTTGAQHTLIDNRDGKSYFLAKQADGNIWMTQNLDLCIGCEGTAPLTSENTNLNVSGVGIYVDGYSESDGVITWTPANATTDPWNYSSYEPHSVKLGDYYIYTSGSDEDDITYNSESECNVAHNDGTCPHYHMGTHYNRSAAFASNNTRRIYDYGTTAENSICPAGWRLPGRYGSVDEFMELLQSSGIINSYSTNSSYSASGNYTSDGFNNMRTAPLFFARTSRVGGSSTIGKTGFYHTSIIYGSDFAGRYLKVEKYRDYPIYVSYMLDDGDTDFGVSIRCLIDAE